MYAEQGLLDPTTLYQGDLIEDFPFHDLDSHSSVVRNESGTLVEQATEDQNYLALIETKKRTVMILSQTCDIQRRTHVIVCPIFDLQEYSRTISRDKVEALKKRTINYLFYLPAHGNFQESFADLQQIHYVPLETMNSYKDKRVLSLSDLGRHHLSWSLASLFGRPAS
ncbi:hypothetical protein K2X96_00660 [Patescibacteria group bacterium]|nr:hypothetical protein [Patescibacteria group bacterium]